MASKEDAKKEVSRLIEMGLICERCANSYKEFCKIIEEEENGVTGNSSHFKRNI